MPDPDRDATAPLTHVVFHVLLSLTHGPLHGYGIMKRVEEDSGLAMGPGTVYGSLNRLLETGLIAEVEAEAGPGADPRRGRAFELTGAGRAALTAEAARITRLARLDEVRRLAPEVRGAR
jgi:DNA-binding PadR family transcriptional regulator